MASPRRKHTSPLQIDRDDHAGHQAVDRAAQAARKARRQFFDTLDRHMHNNATADQLVAAARAMWLSEKQASRVSRDYRLAPSEEPLGGPPKQRRKRTPPKKRAPARDNLYGVESVLPGSFEGGKRR